MDKLLDAILEKNIGKTDNGSPHGIFSCRELRALLTELAEYRRAQQENRPLTLDELRGMDGEPVWVVPINLHEWICDARDGKPEWGMVRKSWVRIWRSETADLMHTDFDFEDYGKTWLAYRSKPKEEV